MKKEQPIFIKKLEQIKFESSKREYTDRDFDLENMYRTEKIARELSLIKKYVFVMMWIAIIYVIASILQGVWIAFS